MKKLLTILLLSTFIYADPTGLGGVKLGDSINDYEVIKTPNEYDYKEGTFIKLPKKIKDHKNFAEVGITPISKKIWYVTIFYNGKAPNVYKEVTTQAIKKKYGKDRFKDIKVYFLGHFLNKPSLTYVSKSLEKKRIKELAEIKLNTNSDSI